MLKRKKRSEVELVVGQGRSKQSSARRAIDAVTTALSAGVAKKEPAPGAELFAPSSSLLKPIAELIAADANAARALASLKKRSLARLVAPTLDSVRTGIGPSNLAITLSQHLAFAIPPYDFDWRWGNFQPRSETADRRNGRIAIHGSSGQIEGGQSDSVAAASGIGLLLTSNTHVEVRVAPYIDIAWKYVAAASGIAVEGSTSGGVDAAAFHNGELVAGVRRTTEFSASRGGGMSRDSGGTTVWVPDVELTFRMLPGEPYIVNYGAWVECDHSSGLGTGAGSGVLAGHVRWIVVERTPL